MKDLKRTSFLTKSAVIAAIYVVLTLFSALFGLSGGMIQLRLSEALTVLPIFTNAAVPGLFIGCIISNLITGCAFWDTVFGSAATLIGAIGTYYLRKKSIFIAQLPPVISNMLIVPLILRFVYGTEGSLPFFVLTVGAGEFICCELLGVFLGKSLKKHKIEF